MVSKPKSPACLVGPGALSWFRANGGEMPEKELITGQQRKMYAKYMAGATTAARAKATPATETPSQAPGGSGESESSQNKFRMDTVGAIALVRGRIAAGVSSGGIFLKHPGRVGQAGVYGAGCWANRTVGVSTSGSGEHLIRTMLASRCVAALDTAVKKKPDDGDGNSEIEDLPPAMKLKNFLQTEFVEATCLRGEGIGGMAAGVIGLIYDDELELCDLVWAHTTASFILAFAGPGTPKEVLSSEVCPQHNIETVDKIEVYASGTTLRLSED